MVDEEQQTDGEREGEKRGKATTTIFVSVNSKRHPCWQEDERASERAKDVDEGEEEKRQKMPSSLLERSRRDRRRREEEGEEERKNDNISQSMFWACVKAEMRANALKKKKKLARPLCVFHYDYFPLGSFSSSSFSSASCCCWKSCRCQHDNLLATCAFSPRQMLNQNNNKKTN